MAGSKHFKKLEKRLAKLGYEFSGRVHSGSMWAYARQDGQEITVSPSCDENTARQIIRKIEKQHGAFNAPAKRNATAIKDRQATERDRQAAELERLDAERDAILKQRDELLSGAAASLTNAQIRALEERVAQIKAQRQSIERLMAAPVTGTHDDKRNARHQSGRRSA